MNIKELTKAEEQVMQAVWSVGQGFANEIVAAMAEPKPAYNTVLTMVRILEKKGFVAHETFNKSNRYYPLVSKEEYSNVCWDSWHKIILVLRFATWSLFLWTRRRFRLRTWRR